MALTYLGDTSALTRRQTRPAVRDVVQPLLLAGEIATCGVIDLELLYSARSPKEYGTLSTALSGFPRAPIDDSTIDRAREVQAMLAAKSQHRAVPLADLVIAACAERAALTVLHYDADYDRIAAVTGQPTRWVVPRGSVD